MKTSYLVAVAAGICLVSALLFFLNVGSQVKFLILVSIFMGICLSATPILFIQDEPDEEPSRRFSNTGREPELT